MLKAVVSWMVEPVVVLEVVVVDGVVVMVVELVVVGVDVILLAHVEQHCERCSGIEQSRPVNSAHQVA